MKTGKILLKQRIREGFRHGDADVAAGVSAAVLLFSSFPSAVAYDVLRQLQHFPAAGGQLHGMIDPFKELRAELVLQLADPQGDRGLGISQPFQRPGLKLPSSAA